MRLSSWRCIASIGAAALLLAACREQTVHETEQQKADRQKIEKVEDLVREKLKDPQSAQFSKVRIVGGLVCGEVNAKNSYGGYSGRQRFWGGMPEATLGEAVVISDEPTSPCDILDRPN